MYDQDLQPPENDDLRKQTVRDWVRGAPTTGPGGGAAGAAALVTAAAEGRKIGRLVVAMGPVDAAILARLAEGWRAVPMVTLLTGLTEAVALVERACPGVFYNEGEPVAYTEMRGFLPWLEVWMVGKDGAFEVAG